MVVCRWSLGDSKSPWVSRILLNNLAALNNAVVWMVSILLLTSNYSNLLSNPLGTVPSVPTTIGITVMFMFHRFFSSVARSSHLSTLSFSFIFTWNSKIIEASFFFLFCFVLFCFLARGLLAGISWSVWISKSQRISGFFFSRTDFFFLNHLSIWSNFNPLHNSHWMTFPPQ